MNDTFISSFLDLLPESFSEEQRAVLGELLKEHCSSYEIRPVEACNSPESYVLPEAYYLFIAAKEQDGRLSARSVKQYTLCLEDTLRTLCLPLEDITISHLRAYLSEISKGRNGKPLSSSTLNQRKSILRSFFHWLYEEEYITKDPSVRIHVDRHKAKPKTAFTDVEIEQLRNACTNKRDRAIVDLLISSGVRISELVSMNIDDVDFADRRVQICGKGGKWRTAYFDGRAQVSLNEYLLSRNDDSDALFVSSRKPYERLECDGIRRMFRVLSQDTGIKPVNPHRFRHTMATAAVNRGMPIESVQILLGHSNIETTLRYAHVSSAKVQNDHRTFVI